MAYTKQELLVAGKAVCGCWYHAEQGIPCQHDLELLRSNQKKTQAKK